MILIAVSANRHGEAGKWEVDMQEVEKALLSPRKAQTLSFSFLSSQPLSNNRHGWLIVKKNTNRSR